MSGFLVAPDDVEGNHLTVRGDEAHHLMRVRRHRIGDIVEVIDGRGSHYSVRLETVEGGNVVCEILDCQVGRGESKIDLELAPALIKGPRFDYVIEKATELGVVSIRPTLTERGVVKLGSENKLQRWNRLCLAAAKQCGRSLVPEVAGPAELATVVSTMLEHNDQVLMADPQAGSCSLEECLEMGPVRRLGLLIGPEGGFSPGEVNLGSAAGVALFSWGDRTLRADTANVVLAAIVMHEVERRSTKNRSTPIGL
jgi:16S rRNA (uracil1498-N3)-methyltransferase